MIRPAALDTPPTEPHDYVRGGFGGEMDRTNDLVMWHFLALPGWHRGRIDPQETVFLSGFFVFIALASSPSARMGPSEAATGARASVARSLMTRGTKVEALTERIKAFHGRLNEYSALWIGVLKGANSFGAFSSRVFENMQVGDRTREGYIEHLNAFPDFCERRITAFHATTSAAWRP